jgi:hypothetical protein
MAFVASVRVDRSTHGAGPGAPGVAGAADADAAAVFGVSSAGRTGSSTAGGAATGAAAPHPVHEASRAHVIKVRTGSSRRIARTLQRRASPWAPPGAFAKVRHARRTQNGS